MEPTDNAPGVRLVIYKRIAEGDWSKFTATSSIAQSGGGARDLRFSPAEEFWPVFCRMFPERDGAGRLHGCLSWANHADTEVLVHPPTASRPNEVRIGRIHECFPADVIPAHVGDCILLFVLDNAGKVYPYFTSRRSLESDGWHPAIRDPVLKGLRARRSAKTTAMGYIDIASGRSYTNEQSCDFKLLAEQEECYFNGSARNGKIEADE